MKTFRNTCLAAVAAMALGGGAQAADISFSGNLAGPNDVLSFNFDVASTSTVTLRSYSYAGGTNAAGTAIARGGFDPILALYDAGGTRIASQDDGSGVPADAVTGVRYDVNFSQSIAAGIYTVLLTAYSNFCGTTLSGGCQGGGSFTDATGNPRDSHFAFDILNVATATQTGGGTGTGGSTPVPEPMSLALFGTGLLGLGLIRRRREADAG